MAHDWLLYKNYTITGQFTIFTGGGGLDAVWINKAMGAGGTVQVYEGSDITGRSVGVIDATAIHKHDFKVGLNGCTVVIGGGSAGDITFSYDGIPT